MGIFLSKASTAGSTRPNWARVYSAAVGVRGGAAAASTAETAVGGEASTGSAAAHPAAAAAANDPFGHLPALEVCVCLLVVSS